MALKKSVRVKRRSKPNSAVKDLENAAAQWIEALAEAYFVKSFRRCEEAAKTKLPR